MTLSTSAVGHTHLVSPSVEKAEQQTHSIESYLSSQYIALSSATTVAVGREHFYANMDRDYIVPQIFVVDDNHRLLGRVSAKQLIDSPIDTTLGAIMSGVEQSLCLETSSYDASVFLQQSEALFIPVMHNGKLVGVMGPKEIAQLKEDEDTLDSQLQGASSPLETPYLENSIFTLWRKRSVWLLLLFVAEAYTGTVIKSFEDQLETAIALAFFIPLLIGTGGNTGTQITSTLVRAMALGEVAFKDLGAILRKEVSAAVLIALTIGIAGFARAWMLGVGMEVMIVVSLTLIAITVWSAVVSSIIPMVLRRVNIDPALVSAPFISTLIDGTGLIIYFQIAKVMLTI